ncbi:Uroporphyrinogen-III synthase /uroporphyrinogen-III C-methyltransferase [Planctomycetales bacterium 10988]|nr:Uroporphyrinogen-III synthase /uroporphyrinogen-III C-methyltransferase [Planctomycetales bacterium 10988]
MKKRGKVSLVGAGPGDAGLITLKGVECLQEAELILYDYLVNPEILRHAAALAECICLGRHGHGKLMPQPEITQRMIEAASEGKRVVRLKGGNPTIFGRIMEEVPPLIAAGIEYEIVPGITSAGALPSYAGIPLTDRDVASAVAFVTGQERPGKPFSSLKFDALAAFPGTLVFYMGVTTAKHWSDSLMEAGKDPSTPVALVRRCSWPDQRTILTRLDEVAQVLDQNKPDRLRPPILAIVGEVAATETRWTWFEERPLFGQRILVTRPEDQAEELAKPLRELGAEVLIQPAITIDPLPDWSQIEEVIGRIAAFDWVIFSSKNGVRYFLERLFASGKDLRSLAGQKLAAIGPGTADELRQWHLRADLIPEVYRSEGMVDALRDEAPGKRILLPRASRGRDVMPKQLQELGATIEQVTVYQSEDVALPDPEIKSLCQAGEIDWVTVTSPAIARNLIAMFGEDLKKTKLVSISPVTSTALREAGFQPAAEAREYHMPGVIEALTAASQR